jgi:hypothetical protein
MRNEPRCPYVHIGNVTIHPRYVDPPSFKEEIRRRVREIGGDAVVGLVINEGGVEDEQRGPTGGSNIYITLSRQRLGEESKAIVIRFLDDDCRE